MKRFLEWLDEFWNGKHEPPSTILSSREKVQCKYCFAEIDPRAPVCSNCKEWQRRRPFGRLVLAYASSASATIAIIGLIIAGSQLHEAKQKRIEAQDALNKALAAQNKAEENAPLNQPITDVFATIRLRVKGRQVSEPVQEIIQARLMLVTKIVEIPSIVTGSKHPRPFSDFALNSLETDHFEIVRSEQFILPQQHPDFHEYLMRFHLDLFADPSLQNQLNTTNKPLAKDIDRIIGIYGIAKFLPHDSEILDGIVAVVVNSNVRKVFTIPKQSNFRLDPDRPDEPWDHFGFITTNSFPISQKP